MICSTCGKSNADHLVFCEDCGARLAPRIAPPTPPIGVVPPVAVQPEPPADGPKCSRCGATSAPGMRFCITCGSPLQKASTPAPSPQQAAPAAGPTAPAAPAPTAPIAPARVLGVTAPKAPAETRTCKRCQGTSDKSAQFCRFCGAPLGDAAAARPSQPSQPRLDQTLVTSEPVTVPALDASPASSPAADASASKGRLVLVEKDGSLGRSFPLADQVDVGRESGACLFPDDRYMAPRHARIGRRDGGLTVRDLGTSNGVYLRVRKGDTGVPLDDQDLILLGQQVLRFEIVKDADAGFGAASEHGTLLFGTPAAPRYARLSQRTTEGVSCDVFHVRKPETVLGRESGDVVFPDDPFLSRRHAAVRVSEGAPRTFRLVDLGSSNGTFLRIHGEVPLGQGDEIRVGQQLLRVDLGA